MVSGPEGQEADGAPSLTVLASARTKFRNSRFTQRLLPASLLNFLAGLLAGAGINLLTAIETGPTSVPGHVIVVDSLAWIGAAMFAASAAHVAETAEQRATLSMSKSFTPELNREIRCEAAAEVSLRFWLYIMITFAFVALAAIRIP
jgi:hypothetical protein